MRIKLFEGFNQDDFYTEISYDEYYSIAVIDFDYNYYEKLKRYCWTEDFRADPLLKEDGDNIKMVDLNPDVLGRNHLVFLNVINMMV